MGNEQLSKEEMLKIVREKFERKDRKNPYFCKSVLDFHKTTKEPYIDSISDIKLFKEKYLIPHYKMYNLLNIINEKINTLRNQNITTEDINKAMEELNELKYQLAESRLEVFFCNVFDGNKVVRGFANSTMPYGLLHTGLLVDDIVIEWGRGLLGKSVVNPSIDVRWNDFIFTVELENKKIWECIRETYFNLQDYILNKKDYNQMGTLEAFKIADNQLDVIASVSVVFNTKCKYDLITQNCQNFVTEILKRINLSVNFNGEVGRVMDIAKVKLKPFDFDFYGHKISSRKELDDLVMKGLFFTKLGYDDRRILFSYKSTYEFYERNNPQDQKYKTTEEAKEFWRNMACEEKFGSIEMLQDGYVLNQ